LFFIYNIFICVITLITIFFSFEVSEEKYDSIKCAGSEFKDKDSTSYDGRK
jgi:hypothetical protein